MKIKDLKYLSFGIFMSFCPLMAKENYNLIAIEGMPAAGKTTAILTFASLFEGRCIIMPELNLEPKSFWKNASTKEQGEVFLRLWIERMQTIRDLSEKGEYFLLDRSYLSNLAFSYAMDKFRGTNFYAAQSEFINKNFDPDKDFSLIFVLDVDPELCLQRRMRSDDKIPWPWSEINFLHGLREFYNVELTKICGHKITFIRTDHLTSEEVLQKLIDQIHLTLPRNEERKMPVSIEEEEKLLRYADQHQLGQIRSLPVRVFGFPTIYFRKHCVQLNENACPLFFNNERLKDMVQKYVKETSSVE